MRAARTDVKSLVIGILLGVCLTLVFGQAPAGTMPAQGRYQISAVQQPGRTQPSIYVLDQQTNQVFDVSTGWATRLELMTLGDRR